LAAEITGYYSVSSRWILIGLAAALASVTYELIEKPIRRARRPAVVIFLMLISIIVTLLYLAACTGAFNPQTQKL